MMFLLIVVIMCVLVSATFSGIEAGILSVNRIRLQHQAKLREKAAVKLNRLLARPERLLVTVLLVTNFMNVCAVGLSTRMLVRWLGPAGYGAAFVVWLPLYLGIQLLPKSIFRRFPYRALAAFSEMLRVADLLLSPILAIGSKLYDAFFASRDTDAKKILVVREDFKFLMTESERVGTLDKVEREMIQHVLDFRGVTARDVMSPLAAAHPIKASASIEELISVSRASHLDRLPVISDTGEITGLVNVFEVLLDSKNNTNSVSAYTRRIVTFPPDEPAYNIIRKLRAARSHLAAVHDPNTGTIGIVSSGELIRRLIGAAASQS